MKTGRQTLPHHRHASQVLHNIVSYCIPDIDKTGIIGNYSVEYHQNDSVLTKSKIDLLYILGVM